MSKTKHISTLLYCFAIVLFYSCKQENQNVSASKTACADFEIQNFCPISNYQADSITHKTILLDYENAMEGFTIPSVHQTPDGSFTFKFELKNTTSSAQKFYYKLYYQNESYKFPEYDLVTKREHEFAEENFYGSWEDSTETFRTVTIANDGNYHKIEDEFRIIGNPRNESRYIQRGKNQRWQRNPRVGNYEFLLVVCSDKDLKNTPLYIQNIHEKNKEHFANPYYYYLFGDGKKLENSVSLKSTTQLKVVAQPNLGTGIYIDEAHLDGTDKPYTGQVNRNNYCLTCGNDTLLYKNAPIQQFVNYVDASTKYDNIPVIADVIKDNYSQMDYNWNRCFYKKEELIPTIIQTTKKPCETVISDPIAKKIVMKNPGTKFGEWKKESVGVQALRS